jgi:hypothetical protein
MLDIPALSRLARQAPQRLKSVKIFARTQTAVCRQRQIAAPIRSVKSPESTILATAQGSIDD